MANDNYMTPRKYFPAIKKVLQYDFTDLFSSEVAQSRMNAKSFYTIEDNAFNQLWTGNTYANPPYSRGNLPKYAEYLLCRAKYIPNSISLVPNSTSERWFQKLISHPLSVFCLTDHRIKFITLENGKFVENSNPEFGNAFIYFGQQPQEFVTEFSQWGTIARTI